MKITLTGITKSFGEKKVILTTSLTIESGSFTTLLGPSGCGKTTLLRMIAGLEIPDTGEICFDDRVVFSSERKINVPPEKRGLGFVFQNFALWPHMSVFENVAFGLRAAHNTKNLDDKVRNALHAVQLDKFASRFPHQLSGGQQRVAFARAIVIEPQCILFDEPLSALDALLREEMRVELKELISRLGITAVFVTHDQTEAMSMSDKIAVLNCGTVEQYASPENIYSSPETQFVSGNHAIGALLVFVKSIAEYGTPATLGKRIGYYVFTTEIHRYATVAPIDFGKSAVLASVLVGVCIAMWFLQNYVTSRRSYNIVSGKGSRFTELKLRTPAKILGWAYIAVVLLLSVGIPYFSVISTSLIDLRGYGFRPGNFTFQHYIDLFTENEKGIRALCNSLILAVSAATICAVLGTLIVIAVRKSRSKLGKVVEVVGLLPEMLTGIVLVIGIMLFWNRIYNVIPLYNTLGIMILAYVVLLLPYTIQYVTSSFTQISGSLEAAARVFGGSPGYIFRRVTLPLIMKGVFAGWIMTFMIAFRELVTAGLIVPSNTLVVSIYIVREFEQGSVSVGMAMAVLCVLFTTTALLILNRSIDRQKER